MLLLWFFSPMGLFDAVNHALTTMPTGGFGTRDAGISHFNSPAAERILILFMFLAGVNFALLYWLIVRRKLGEVVGNGEFRTYVAILTLAVGVITAALIGFGHEKEEAFRHGFFQVVSIGTSTGFASADFSLWPSLATLILLMLMIVGASAGSTGGGLKVMRIRLLGKVAYRELIHIGEPRRVLPVKEGDEVIEESTLLTIIGMVGWWLAIFITSVILLGFFEFDESLETIVSLVASSLGNTGPALGNYGPTSTWSSLSPLTLILTSLLMWGGRLELLTVLLIFRMRTWKVLRAGKIDEAGSKILARFSRIMGSFRRQSKK